MKTPCIKKTSFLSFFLFLLLFLFLNSDVLAVVDFQIIGGQRNAKFYATNFSEDSSTTNESNTSEVETSSESSNDSSGTASDKYSGGEAGIAILAQLSPSFPLSLGGSILHQNLIGNSPDRKESYSGTIIGADLMTWAQLGIVQPFIKGSYNLYSDHNMSLEYQDQKFLSIESETAKTKVEVGGKVTGYHVAAGMKFRLSPLMSAVFQGDMAEEHFKSDRVSISQDGYGFFVEEKNVMPELKVMSYAILIGLDVGI